MDIELERRTWPITQMLRRFFHLTCRSQPFSLEFRPSEITGCRPRLTGRRGRLNLGLIQTLTLNALKFLGLVDTTGQTQQALRELVDVEPHTDEAKHLLGTILRQRYDKVFELDLKTATPNQVFDAIGAFGPTGSTKDRAVRFFIKAVDYCGITVSGRLTKGIRARNAAPSSQSNGNRVKPRRKRKAPRPTGESSATAHQGTAMKTIELTVAGGSLTLSGSFNPFELAGDERTLVYDIIDKMKAFEETTTEEDK